MLDDSQIMRNKQIRIAVLLLKPLQQIQNLRLNRNIQCRHRLVTDDKLRVERQRTRDADTLAAAAVEFMRVGVDEALRQADSLHQLIDTRLAFLQRTCTMNVQRLNDGFKGRHAGIQRGKRVLKDHLDPLFVCHCLCLGHLFRDILSVKQNFAARCLQQHGKQSSHCGFSAAGFTDNADRAAARNGETDAVDGVKLACGYGEDLFQVSDADQFVTHILRPPSHPARSHRSGSARNAPAPSR